MRATNERKPNHSGDCPGRLFCPGASTAGRAMPERTGLPRDWMTVSGDVDDFIFYESPHAPSER